MQIFILFPINNNNNNQKYTTQTNNQKYSKSNSNKISGYLIKIIS